MKTKLMLEVDGVVHAPVESICKYHGDHEGRKFVRDKLVDLVPKRLLRYPDGDCRVVRQIESTLFNLS